jgi:proteasome lid subunit RPN8/RPN11
MKSKAYTVKIKAQPAVVMEAEVARKIRQHARTSMKAEVCGVLIGSMGNDRTVIEACIPGINAAQGGAHVTFTQDTWQHIYKIKDRQFPEEKIVGWYHSHPGFGVFLSEHDLFIHENFFSSPRQVAWVYDPHTDEEGCFGWVGGKTEKLSGMRFGYSQDVQIDSAHVDESAEDGTPDFTGQVRVGPEVPRREPEWLTWTIRIGSYLVVLALGFILGREYLAWRIVPAAQEIERRLMQDEELLQRCEPELGSCVSRLRQKMMPLNPAPLSPGAGAPNQPKPSQPPPKAPASPGKGNDAKH